jgi:biopolymer transport protein ExbD
MAASLHDENEDITGINLTPMVDVMLVLLIIFMVTTSYIVTNAIALNLPQEESGESQEAAAAPFTFTLNREGQLFLNGKVLAWDEVAAAINQEKNHQGGSGNSLQAVISADKDISHGLVMNLIDLIRKNGINNFAINVETPTPAPH